MKKLFFAVLPALAASAASADTISADRPGFASGPVPLASGIMQIEAGYQYTSDGSTDVHNLPQLIFRAGVADNLEFLAAWAGYSEIDFPGGSVDGISDLSVGLRTRLAPDRSAPTTFGLFGGLSLPVGDRALSSDAVDPTLGLFWTHESANQPTLFGTALLSSATVGNDRRLTGGVSVGAGFPIDSRRGLYAEVFTLFSERTGPAHNFNGGMTYLVNDDLQLDIEGGIGLNDRAGDYFFGFGIARRW